MVKYLENYGIAKIGTRTFAVAVLEAMFVMDTENIDGQMFRESWNCQNWNVNISCHCVGGNVRDGH